MPNSKPILCLDFDGVIHSYEKGWQDGRIYGRATEGFFTWAAKAQESFRLYIYSSRSATPLGRSAMHEWLYRQWLYWRSVQLGSVNIHVSDPLSTGEYTNLRMDFTFCHEKPPAFLTIDDRCIQFQGNWNDIPLIPTQLLDFKPWTWSNSND